MDVCVGVCILCNYAWSSYTNDTPAGNVYLAMSVPFARVFAETEHHCVEQLLSVTLWEHRLGWKHGGGGNYTKKPKTWARGPPTDAPSLSQLKNRAKEKNWTLLSVKILIIFLTIWHQPVKTGINASRVSCNTHLKAFLRSLITPFSNTTDTCPHQQGGVQRVHVCEVVLWLYDVIGHLERVLTDPLYHSGDLNQFPCMQGQIKGCCLAVGFAPSPGLA